MNLSKKLTFSFLALAFIPMVVITLIVETSSYTDRINQTNDHNLYTAQLKADNMHTMLIAQKNAMQTLAMTNEFMNMDVNGMVTSLKAMVKSNPEITNMYVTDLSGMQIARDSGKAVNISDRDYYQAIRSGKDFVFSDAVVSKSTGKVIIIAAIPIKNSAGQIIGVMGSTFNMDTLNNALTSNIGQLEDRQEIIYLTDAKGNVMLHPDNKYVSNLTNWAAMAPVMSASSNQKKAMEYTNADGVDCLAASSPVDELNWAVVVENPKADVTSSIWKSITFVIIVCGALLLAAAACARLLTQNFITPLEELKEKTMLLANGDLRVQLDDRRNDEFGAVAQSFNEMSRQLKDVMGKISVAAQQVASGSKNISDSGNMLASGASTQASSVEELSASISEITAQTSKNADNASEANNLTNIVKNEAAQGNEQMTRMLVAMEEINESSTNIAKIIKTIDEIAFQTNILALNAAVEAARAGQYGKGFAVVAEEVRNLAARSAKAAKETTDIIETSFDKVNHGTQLANETAEALKEINAGVSKVAVLVNEIAEASTKQNSALQMINQGVLQVSNVVQTNSATAEESAAASVELSAQADLLQEAVRKFKM
jgi:methyl-accepting chemotaxis protein